MRVHSKGGWRRRLRLLGLALTVLLACQQNMAQDSSSSPKRDVNAVLAAHDKELLALSGVVGVYVGTLEDHRTLCLKVMLAHKNPELEERIPKMIEGYKVIVEVTGEARAMENP